MSKYSLSIKFYPLLSAEKKTSYPIYCRIIVNRKKAEFNTHVKIGISKWDKEKERVKGNPEANAILAGIEQNIRSQYSNLNTANKRITAVTLRDLVTERTKVYVDLLDYYDRFQSEIAELKDEFTISTIKKYKTIRIHLEAYLKSKGIQSITLSDFDLKRFSEFEHYLRTIAKLNTNTTTKYLKQLKAVFNRAVKFAVIEKVPFNDFKFKYEQTERGFLTKEEIVQLEEFVAPNESIERVKDVFLFSIYTGLRYSDVNGLTRANLRIDKNKNTWLDITMLKTAKTLNIPLINKAVEVLKKYEKESEVVDKLLPVISNQKINAYLKVLGDLAGLNKVLTFHMARHTFATTITLSNDVPIEIVSKMLGHSSITTTQIYAKITNEYLLKTANLLNEKV